MSFQLYDLRVEVVCPPGQPIYCGAKPGDYFELRGEMLHLPAGNGFSIYSLAAVLPLLAAKQRDTPAADWITTDALVACPDPHIIPFCCVFSWFRRMAMGSILRVTAPHHASGQAHLQPQRHHRRPSPAVRVLSPKRSDLSLMVEIGVEVVGDRPGPNARAPCQGLRASRSPDAMAVVKPLELHIPAKRLFTWGPRRTKHPAGSRWMWILFIFLRSPPTSPLLHQFVGVPLVVAFCMSGAMEQWGDDAPIALRRKRRSSSAYRMPTPDPSSSPAADEHDGTRSRGRRKKRVRFSDPGPETISAASTGITPMVQRTSIDRYSSPPPTASAPCGSSRRRHSLPTTPTSTRWVDSGEIQFTPLRQALSERTRRRLRRNHLSEEINQIEQEIRLSKRDRHEVETLKAEVLEKEKSLAQMTHELEELRQFSVGPKGVLADQRRDNDLYSVSSGNDYARIYDDEEAAMIYGYEPGQDGPASVEASNQSAERCESVHDGALLAELETARNDKHRLLSKLKPFLPGMEGEDPGSEALDAVLDQILTSLTIAKARAEDANEALRLVSSDIASLGFVGQNLDEMISTMKTAFRQTRLELEYLTPGENVEGFEGSKLLDLLLGRIRDLLHRLRDGEQSFQIQLEQDSALRRNFETTLSKLEAAEGTIKTLNQRLNTTSHELSAVRERETELTKQAEGQSHSISRLQNALDSYRAEVQSLESLVNSMESDYSSATAQLRREMDEAVADLSGKYEVEHEMRCQAEAQVDEQRKLVLVLEERVTAARAAAQIVQSELQSNLQEKERRISSLEKALTEQDVQHSSDLGIKHVQLANLSADIVSLKEELAETQNRINVLDEAKSSLERRLKTESDRGVQAVEIMQAELLRSVERISDVKNDYLRTTTLRMVSDGPDSSDAEETGLLTPKSGKCVRFALEPTRKRKRRYDSGIGIIDEADEMQEV